MTWGESSGPALLGNLASGAPMNNVIHTVIGTSGILLARPSAMIERRSRWLWYLLAVVALLATAILVAMD